MLIPKYICDFVNKLKNSALIRSIYMHKNHISAYIKHTRKEDLIMEKQIEKAEVIIHGNAVSIAYFDA